MKKLKFTEGQKMPNGITFIKEVPSNTFYRRYGLFKCHCGNEFRCLIYSIHTGRTKSCKCLSGKFLRVLTKASVLDIKRMLKIGRFTYKEIAEKHNCSGTNIHYINCEKIHKQVIL